jgi:DNA polymerase-3 subunit delta'
MSFADFPGQKQAVELLQRSLSRRRLGHAYLFLGEQLDGLEALARTLAKTLNCLDPVRATPGGPAIDCCDGCLSCRKIDHGNHGDVQWVRPESKSRIITIEQIRDLMQTVHLKPTEAEYKVATIVGADRLNVQAANAFLKTLEEPPPRSVLILLTTEPQRLLDTILSRCLRLTFAGGDGRPADPEFLDWLRQFSAAAVKSEAGILSRYRLLGSLQQRLAELKTSIQTSLSARSPLEQYDDADPRLRDKWEDELAAAIEAEYRRRRSEVMTLLQWWLRDIWLISLRTDQELLSFPDLQTESRSVAERISSRLAEENLQVLEQTQRLLHTNVQESLAIEVGLLKLSL